MGILMYCILIAMNFMKIRQGVLAESLSIERKFGHDASLSFVKSKAPNSHKHTENSYIKPRNKRLRKRVKKPPKLHISFLCSSDNSPQSDTPAFVNMSVICFSSTVSNDN